MKDVLLTVVFSGVLRIQQILRNAVGLVRGASNGDPATAQYADVAVLVEKR